MRHKVHSLVVGSRGCGKTSCILKAVLNDLPDSVYTTTTLTFSSQTSSREAQEVRHSICQTPTAARTEVQQASHMSFAIAAQFAPHAGLRKQTRETCEGKMGTTWEENTGLFHR